MKENILRIETRIEWRNWLMKNFTEVKEVWLVYPKKTSGEKRIQYNDAVEEALCFGWIDSTQKTLDSNHTMTVPVTGQTSLKNDFPILLKRPGEIN